jgi:hypothetical protein
MSKFRGDYQDTDNGELADLIGDEPGQPGMVRVRFFDGSEDIMPKAMFEWQFEYSPVEDDDDEWTDEDEARVQAWRDREARKAAEVQERIHREWFARYGKHYPCCDCTWMPAELAAA